MKNLGEAIENLSLSLFDVEKADLLESYVDLLSGIYLAFLNGECTWDLFEETALILERFIYQDTEQLKRLYDSYIRSKKANGNSVISTMYENNHCDRLVALGLVWQEYTTVLNGSVNVEYHLTEAGRLLAGVL